jgi:hypothetical protein
LRGRDERRAALDLFARRHQRAAIAQGPAVELHVGEFEPADASRSSAKASTSGSES